MHGIMKNNILKESHILNINKRYSDRFNQHGYSPLTLGWANKNQQNQRFRKFYKFFKIEGKSILDIGCGFGDFLSFLKKNSYLYDNYIGIDINSVLLEKAREIHNNKSIFIEGNILKDDFKKKLEPSSFDYVLAIGIFNLNFLNDESKMMIFFEEMLKKMIFFSKSHVIVDFIPRIRLDNYQEEKYIMTFELDLIAKVMKNLSLKYTIDFTQNPNPMSEAILLIDL